MFYLLVCYNSAKKKFLFLQSYYTASGLGITGAARADLAATVTKGMSAFNPVRLVAGWFVWLLADGWYWFILR
jgi:hypothetical protein